MFVCQASGAEQKLKQVQEELKCQRQNAESSRLQHQQRTKELEKQHQKVRRRQAGDRCLQAILSMHPFLITYLIVFVSVRVELRYEVCYLQDITELQKERQLLEKQHQQEVNKLNQELQQARTLHNALQAQADKVNVHKKS